MASESENSPRSGSPRSILERLINSRNRDLSLLIPFILGFSLPAPDPHAFRLDLPESTTDPDENSENRSNPDDDNSGNRSTSDESTRREGVVLFNSVIDSDGLRVGSGETRTDPNDVSMNRSSPDDDSSRSRSSSDESTRRGRVILFNSLFDPVGLRVESGETRTDPDEISVDRSSPDDDSSRNRSSSHESTQRERMILFNSLTDSDLNSETRPSHGESTQRDRIILINPLTQSMMIMEGIGLDSLLRGAQGKGGQPPASKSSVEAMPRVEIKEGDEIEGECVICLEEFKVGNIIKKMPCQHGFHENCIEKWLSIHGSCPICRHKMPIDDVEERENSGIDDVEERESSGRVNGDIWLRVSFGGGRRRGGGDAHDLGLGSVESDHMEN